MHYTRLLSTAQQRVDSSAPERGISGPGTVPLAIRHGSEMESPPRQGDNDGHIQNIPCECGCAGAGDPVDIYI